jgi:hypothetical protein
MKKIVLLSAPLCLLAAVSGCHKEAPVPVGRVEVSPKSLRLGLGEIKPISLKWIPSAPLSGLKGDPMVFVHLVDDAGEVLRTFDHPLPKPWTPGTPIADDFKIYQSGIAEPLPAGNYRLTVGLFDSGGHRWALDGLGLSIAKSEYVAATVEASAQTSCPKLEFAERVWMPAEATGDRQVPTRRWLINQGAVRLLDVKASGTAWMVLRIPDGTGEGQRLVVNEGSNTPSVIIRSTCGDQSTSISGPGFHEVEVAVSGVPQDGAQACRIILAPNFYLETPDSPAHRSVSLENIAWIPGPPAAAPAPAAGS